MGKVQKSPRSFSGTIENIDLISLAQVICLAQTNHAIAVQSISGKGTIYARSGSIYHAQCGERLGEEAFHEIFRWTKGKFAVALLKALKTDPSITSRWEYLLVQVAQQRMEEPDIYASSRKLDSERLGFSGTIKNIELTDLVQLICQSGGNHTLKIVSSEGTGLLHARSGQICHAEVDELYGEEAFERILHWQGGHFCSLDVHEIEEPTINASWEALLMMALRRRDEVSTPPGMGGEELETETPDGDAEVDLLSSGKPRPDSGAPVNEMRLGSVPAVGFSGTTVHIELTDLLQLFCLGKSMHQIVLQSPEGSGVIFAGSGSICHAAVGDQEGERAFFQMHRWADVTFETKPARNIQPRETIHKPWEFLLIEGARFGSQAIEDDVTPEGPAVSRGTFRGHIHEISLPDLIHLVCLARANYVITLVSTGKEARIYIRGGQIFHAQTGDQQGAEAFFEVFRWINGHFAVELLPEESAVPTSIEIPWEYLLMEAVRLLDEASRTGEEGEEGDSGEPLSEAEAFEKRMQKMQTLQELESFSKKLAKMRFVERIRLALTGDKEARSILIRDPNRMIQASVIRNPRISEQEVLFIANSKNVDEEVLRQIASNRKWISSYALRLALVNNPKTPLPKSLQFVTTLMSKDLSVIAKSRNIPEAVVQAARRKVTQSGTR